MRRSSILGFVSRFIPNMSPVRAVHPSDAATPTLAAPSTIRFGSSTQVQTSSSSADTVQDDPPVLLLEGDTFDVSHDGVARTFYHLKHQPRPPSSTPVLGIEEYYDLKEAHKTFVLREEGINENYNDDHDVDSKEMLLGKRAQGLAPMGRALGKVDLQEIDEGVFGSAGTGATTWESSLAMSLFFADHSELLRGDLLEIGSGVGGSVLCYFSPLACHHDLRLLQSVTLTDGNDRCVQQCRKNIRDAWQHLSALSPIQNDDPPDIQVRKLDWNDDVDKSMIRQYDTIIACDVCYLYPDIEPLTKTIQSLLKKDGCLHLFGPYNRGAIQHLCQRMHMDMDVEIESLDLERYRLRPADSDPLHALENVALPQERVYASKSQATILHVTVRHRKEAHVNDASQRPNENMNDID